MLGKPARMERRHEKQRHQPGANTVSAVVATRQAIAPSMKDLPSSAYRISPIVYSLCARSDVKNNEGKEVEDIGRGR